MNFTVSGVLGSHLHKKLRPLISCSSGSACTRGEPSHVLKAIGHSSIEAEASLRLSLGRETNDDQIEQALDSITKVVHNLRQP